MVWELLENWPERVRVIGDLFRAPLGLKGLKDKVPALGWGSGAPSFSPTPCGRIGMSFKRRISVLGRPLIAS